MSSRYIHFFYESPGFEMLNPQSTRLWIQEVISQESKDLEELNFIFCDDEYLLKINQEFLQHDFYTDIITFDNTEIDGKISGDLYISVERVRDNAGSHEISFQDELDRVMIHGVLHLLGFNDKTPEETALMRKKEEGALLLRLQN